jgi:succinate-semialdehyde dehydrogenase/glutarate-semialdehyde dehydrogenase
VTGGDKHPVGDLYFRPTILTKMSPEMTAFKEEIFGPVIAVLKFKTEEEAVALANATRDRFYETLISAKMLLDNLFILI